MHIFKHHSAISAVAINPSGEFVITGSDDGATNVWTTKGAQKYNLIGHKESITSIDVDDRQIATGSLDGTILI